MNTSLWRHTVLFHHKYSSHGWEAWSGEDIGVPSLSRIFQILLQSWTLGEMLWFELSNYILIIHSFMLVALLLHFRNS